MAEQVTVKLEVDADGAVKAVRGSGEAFEELSHSSMDADEAMERVGDSAVQAGQDVERSAENAADSTRKLANATNRAASAQVDMGRASGNATQILFSAGDAIQDVQFGFAGAANNIAFMAEQFADVQRQAGGTTNALKAIATSLTGAGGVILGFQALLVAAPMIIDFFSDTEEGAEKTEDALEGLADTLIDVEGLGDVELQPLSPERAREVAEALEGERDTAQALADDLQALASAIRATEEERGRAGPRRLDEARRAQQLREELELQGASLEEINRLIAREEERLRFAEASLKAVEAQSDELSDQTGLAAFLEEFGLQRAQDEQATADAIESQALGLERIQGINIPEISGIGTVFEEARETLGEGTAQSLEDVAATLRVVESAIESTTSQTLRNRLRETRDELQGLQQDMRGVKDETKDTSESTKKAEESFLNIESAVSGSLSNAFLELGRSIGEGQKAMAALGRAAANIIGQIAQAIGQQLIAQGAALIASAILPGQQGNAAAGVAYIAAGSALTASAGALSAIGGGGGSTAQGRGGDRTTIRGGGIADVRESRYHGGPVAGGQMYETHGLGQREYFVPNMSGAIMTQGQIQQQQNTGPRRIDVRTTVNAPEWFDVETRIREESDTKRTYQRL